MLFQTRSNPPDDFEWVADDAFLRFIALEEAAEQRRVHRQRIVVETFEEKIRANGPRPIAQHMQEVCYYQQRAWEKKRQAGRR